ncbi:MAG: AbrB/MazE/SpoVT family DNA-binding domain-containing protein [Parvularculaceae bacterium]
MQISKWGNSLAIRLPAAVVEALGLKEGDEVEVTIADRKRFGLSRAPTVEERLRDLQRHRDKWPKDFKFDRGEANER